MSIMRQMKDKAIAMAEAMAERARSPQDIEAARQRLVAEIQGGRVPAYVGVPLVQDLTQRLTQAKAQMAQQVAGMGVPQAPQGAPIAQQVMQQAQPAGVEALPSNLPTSYAPGGLVAFEEGGQVERYNNTGLVGGTASQAAMSIEDLVKLYRTDPALAEQAARGMNRWGALRQIIGAGVVPGTVLEGGTAATLEAAKTMARMTPQQRQDFYKNPMIGAMSPDTALGGAIMNAPGMEPATSGYFDQMGRLLSTAGKTLVSAPGYGLSKLFEPSTPATPAAATPAAVAYDPTMATRRADYQSTGAPPGVQPGAGTAPGVAMPKLNLPAAPALTDYSFLKQLPKESQEASEKAITAKKKELEDIDNPLFKAREERLSGREAAVDKDSAIGRALNIMSLGFGIAGSEKRTLAGALSDSRQGIADLIKGEAANRAAKERLEDLRDNLTQQRAAAQKGNSAAAEAAGQRVSDDLYKAANLNATAMHYGNTEALQRYQTNQQGILGLAQIQQQNAATNASLQLGREKLGILKEQVAAGNKRAEAALAGAQHKAYAAFQSSPAYRQAQEQAKKMDPIQAQRFMQQEWLKYSANAIPSLLGGSDMGIPSFSDLYKATE